MKRFVVSLLCASLGTSAARASRASDGKLVAADEGAAQLAARQILESLDYRFQEQLTVVRGAAMTSEASRPPHASSSHPGRLGLIELGAGVSFWGIGLAGGAGFERVAEHNLHGGYAHLAAEWRPMALTNARIGDRRAFHWIDPQLAWGVRLGGLRGADGSLLRAAMTLGLGVDIGWARRDVHPVITIRYRADVLTAPTRPDDLDNAFGTPEHFLLLGIGIRTAE